MSAREWQEWAACERARRFDAQRKDERDTTAPGPAPRTTHPASNATTGGSDPGATVYENGRDWSDRDGNGLWAQFMGVQDCHGQVTHERGDALHMVRLGRFVGWGVA